MTGEIYSNLESVGYKEIAMDKNAFSQVFNHGTPNLIFTDIITWLSGELINLCDLENAVSKFTEEDLSGNELGFFVEISSLLKELGCPIKQLTTGPVEERLVLPEHKMLVIDYLFCELVAAKINALKTPKKESPKVIELNESKTAEGLRETLICLGFQKPPEDITPYKLFNELKNKLTLVSHPSSPKEIVGSLLFCGGRLSEKQWFQLEKLYNEIYQEYKNRRILLLTRMDVTINSFLWADKLKNKAENVINIYNKQKQVLKEDPSVKIADILSSTADLAFIEKTSSASVRKNTVIFVNKHIIGEVPDRGGRPQEQQPPPPEVPSWQKNDSSSRGGFRQQQSSDRGGYRGDRGSYRGDRDSYRGDRDSYRGDRDSYRGDRDSYRGGDRDGHRGDRGSYRGDRGSYRGDRDSYRGGDRDGQRGSYRGSHNEQHRDHYQSSGGQGKVHIANNNYQPSTNYNQGSREKDVQGYQPVYQTPQYGMQYGNVQSGFGGYAPAGDNFQQYGAQDAGSQYQGKSRGGYQERGSRPFRGQSRGRGRY